MSSSDLPDSVKLEGTGEAAGPAASSSSSAAASGSKKRPTKPKVSRCVVVYIFCAISTGLFCVLYSFRLTTPRCVCLYIHLYTYTYSLPPSSPLPPRPRRARGHPPPLLRPHRTARRHPSSAGTARVLAAVAETITGSSGEETMRAAAITGVRAMGRLTVVDIKEEAG